MKSAIIVHSNIMKKVDGMANYYRGLCEYAAASNHKIDIFLLGNQREKKIPEKSVKFYFVPTDTSFQLLPNAFLPLSPVFYLKLLWYFHSTFKSERYECIQISSAHPFCFTAVLVAKRLNIPVVGSYHTLLPEYVPYWTQEKFSGVPCGRLLAKLLHVLVAIWTYQVYGLSDLIVSPTSKVQQYLHNKFPRTRIAVIGRGVDSDLFKPLPKRNAPLRLLYVGRISVEKNLEQLSFLKNHKDLHLSVVGEGSDMDRMKEVLPFAEFKGKLENCELAWEYGSSDIFIFPSRTDAYANVASEALSSGLPVIAFDDAGVEDRVKQGVNGFLASTIDDFESAVLSLKDDALRNKMSHQARLAARDLKWETIFDQQFAVFLRAAEERDRKLKQFFPILRKVILSFNFSHAFLGSLRMGFYIFLANMSAGILPGLSAGLRQSFISFFMVGINISFFEFLSLRSRRLSIMLPSLLTTVVATSIHTLRGTPNITATAATVFGLALFNFTMLSEIQKRHATIAPWELLKIFYHFLIRSMKKVRIKVTSNV